MARLPATALPVDARILDVAIAHVRQHGPDRLSISRVAHEAGMSHANVYRYYPSKAALIDEITADWLRPLEAGLRAIVDAPDPAFDKFERMVLALLRGYRGKLDADPWVFALLPAAVEAQSPVARRHRTRCQGEFHRLIEEAAATGLFELVAPQKALTVFSDALHRFIDPLAIVRDATIAQSALEARASFLVGLVVRAFIEGRV
jgi:AcrR family transcriptional regulator